MHVSDFVSVDGIKTLLAATLLSISAVQVESQPIQPIHGVSVSKHQGDINWIDVVQTNVRFAYIQATNGATYKDPLFASNVNKSYNAILPTGPYHSFEVGQDPNVQLQNFLDSITGHSLVLSPTVIVKTANGQSPDKIRQDLKQFMQQLEERTGCTPIIYTYASFFHTNLGPDFNRYPLWLAEYASLSPDMPADKLFQYSDTGNVNGIKGFVDMSLIKSGMPGLNELQCAYQLLVAGKNI